MPKLAEAFAESLDLLDACILLEIYPAREKPIEGIDSGWLLAKMKLEQKQVLSKEALMGHMRILETDVLLTMGAGDIDTLVEPIEKILLSRYT